MTGADAGREASATADTADATVGDAPADGAAGGAFADAAAGGAPAEGVLVVGYGNALRGDDGLGSHIAARLVEDPRFAGATVVAAHQLTPELAIDVSAASLVILVDASSGDRAGAIVTSRVDPASAGGSASSHHLDPAGLVTLARDLYGAAPAVFVVSVGAASFDLGDRLSPAVERALPDAVEVIAGIVGGHRDA